MDINKTQSHVQGLSPSSGSNNNTDSARLNKQIWSQPGSLLIVHFY